MSIPKTSGSSPAYVKWPVGHPESPDPALMGKEELDKRRDTVARLQDLAKKAEKGDKKAVPAIREILDESPDLAWRLMNLSKLAESQFIEKMTREKDLAAKEATKHQLQSMRAEIAGENASPMERLLAERVVITWLQLQLYEGIYASSIFKSMTIAQCNYYQKRIDQAHGRYLSAIRTLAQIRKLGPAVQINIADKQVNTAG